MMAAKPSHNNAQHDHLTLPCFPSCENCLAWSDDALAFAGGPSVYFLKRKAASADSLTWTKESLRVATFTQEERPEQSLATISDFSLGEEQSDPVIAALAWSSPGLGLHCRAVLAVLTTNLLLSIWETNGVQHGWRRSCILNDYLAPQDFTTSSSASRLSHRVRCFAWSRPFIHPIQPKWGSHFLAIADDDGNLLFYSIAKKAKHGYGQWSISQLSSVRIDSRLQDPHKNDSQTTLQQLLLQRSPVHSLSISEWQDCTTNDHAKRVEARAVISCRLPYVSQTSNLSFEVTISGNVMATGDSFIDTATMRELSNTEKQKSGMLVSRMKPAPEMVYRLDDDSQWCNALKPSHQEFSDKNQLDGLVRLRFWGYATSPADDLEAAAVTLHPLDTYEYTPPASERCQIVFRPLKASSLLSETQVESEEVVLGHTLDFIVRQVGVRQFKSNTVDHRILQAYYAWLLCRNIINDARNILKIVLEKIETTESGNITVSAQHTDVNTRQAELCTMCGSLIEMRSPITSAVCQKGHLFTRCNLSLVSIQQPRISKQCSGCKRHFLDISKLGPLEGPSLAQDLFDEFDVCPYCREKYQG